MTTDANRCLVAGCGGQMVPVGHQGEDAWECDSPTCGYWETRYAGTPPDEQHTALPQE